jgi:type III secretion system YscD/HrpQ family protein
MSQIMATATNNSNGQLTTWLIKILTGPHQGAELQAPPGRLLIGSDEASDIVIADKLVSPQHAALDLGSKELTIEPLGGRVYCNGKRIQNKSEKVPVLSFLTLGGSTLVAGLATQDWPLLSPADIPSLEPDPVAEEKPAAAQTETPATPAGEKKVESAATPPPKAKARSPRLWRAVVGICLGLVLLAVWAVLAWYYRFDFSDHPDAVSLTPKEKLTAVIEKAGLTKDVQIENAGDAQIVKGYVDTDDELNALSAGVRDDVPGVVLRVWSRQHMEATTRSLLQQLGLDLAVGSSPDGQMRISGYVDNPEAWIKAKEVILKEVPGIKGIDDHVGIHSYDVRAAPLSTPVTLSTPTSNSNPVANPSVASRPSPSSTPRKLSPPTVTTVTTAPVILPIVPIVPNRNDDSATPAPTAQAPNGVFIEEIRRLGDGTDYVRLSTGEVCFTGARLPNNWMVKEIQKGAIVIQNRTGDTIQLALGDNIWDLAKK